MRSGVYFSRLVAGGGEVMARIGLIRGPPAARRELAEHRKVRVKARAERCESG